MAHKSYEDYTVEDFITDESFINWVVNPESIHQHFWESWVAQHPERRKDIEEARQFIRSMGFETHRLSAAEVAYDRRKLKDSIQQTTPVKQHPAVFMRARMWSRVAAMFVGLLTLAFAYYYLQQSEQQLTYTTAYGETKTVVLPDSSVVTLNANSTLTYPAGWEQREVWLEGEAFFNVRKVLLAESIPSQQLSDPARAKFTVHTEDVTVEVLGTEFNVNNRRGKTEVVLNSGKVKLKAKSLKDTEIEMIPGDYVAFAGELQAFERKRVNAEDYSAWKQNQLVFKNTSFAGIASTLKDNYGLHIVFEHPDLARFRFTGTTPADSLDVLFTKLSRLFPIKIIQKEGQIIMKKQ